jgi:CPA1 family monovalent cation:H+ antiporter
VSEPRRAGQRRDRPRRGGDQGGLLGLPAGGIAAGLLVVYLLPEIRERLDDPATEATMSLVSGYAAFLPADQFGLSGVLSTVACGLHLGYRAPELQGPQTRLRTQTL